MQVANAIRQEFPSAPRMAYGPQTQASFRSTKPSAVARERKTLRQKSIQPDLGMAVQPEVVDVRAVPGERARLEGIFLI